MPCRDYYDDHPNQYFKDILQAKLEEQVDVLKKRVAFAESALCMMVQLWENEDFQLDEIPQEFYDGAGIKYNELVLWWSEHSARDEEIKKQKREAALKKLTAEERKLLGV